MCALSNDIRERASWREEMKYGVIVERWRREVLEREEAGNLGKPSRRLTPAMVKSCYLQTTTTSSSLWYLGQLRT